MKNKIIPLHNNIQIQSCGTCHNDTIEAGWCANCIDKPEISKYTLNPVQSDVYNILEQNPVQSLIVASKTGTGKTWCAYEAIRKYYESYKEQPPYIFKETEEQSKKIRKIIWLNPLKQIVREKVEELRDIFKDKHILELTGDTSDEVGFGRQRNQFLKDNDIIVCSYEMLDSLTRKPDVYTELSNIGLIVIDEIHSIGDFSRGGKLDGALTRFLLKHHDVQIVALSATFENLKDLENYFNQFLEHHIKIVTSEFTPIKANIDPSVRTYGKTNLELFVDLVGNYLDKDGGIMCMQLSIPGCKKLAEAINNTYGPNIARVHFSELQKDEKYKTVDDFNEGKFKVLCCTPTLLAGVNVAATVIILNLSFFNPLTMENDILPVTAIRQATGRVGRPPRYKEGYVTYMCSMQQMDEAVDILQSPNVVPGALNHVLEQVLNLEISLKTQSFDDLADWFLHTYSGYSSSASAERMGEVLKWLLHHEYIKIISEGTTGKDKILTTLPKGKTCAQYFVNPPFFEDCLNYLKTPIITTENMVETLELLLALPSSPCNWNDRKGKQLEDYSDFIWMRTPYGTFDFNLVKPTVQWADQIEFAMHGVTQAAQDLKMHDVAYNSSLIETCMEESLIPVPLIKLKMKLDKLGVSYLGSKYILYLYLNGVKVENDKLSGPNEFKTPQLATFVMGDDDYYNKSFNDTKIRFANAASTIVKYYGDAGEKVRELESEWE